MRWNVYKRFWNGFANALSIAVVTVFMAGCSDVDVAGGASGDAGVVAIKDREIAGVTQKGPFLTGSAVTVQELNGETLSQTGKSFRTKVKSDLGDFVLGGVSLVSPYALLEVNGYYLNEVSWEKSKGKVELYALTDLSDRSHVNVNILTHLTVDRILTLVRREGKSFAEAKKQAEKEVLKSFAIAGDIGNSEDLDLFEDKNGSALLAVSVLMQGERTVAAFSELLSKAAIAFADGGTWNGLEKAEVADWAFLTEKEYWEHSEEYKMYESEETGVYEHSIDDDETLLNILKNNVMSWKGADSKDSTLEKYIYDFWVNEYGLGECVEKNYGEIRKNTDEHSKFYNAKFKCDGKYERWIWTSVVDSQDSSALEIVDLRDGNTYKTKRFGNVVWTTDNLRYGPKPLSGIYLYDRDEALEACPEGTRLPRYNEGKNLLLQYGGAGKNAADSLMSKDGFNALQDGFPSSYFMDLDWVKEYGAEYQYDREGVAIWISTKDIYSGEEFVLWIDSAGADVKKIINSVEASVRCVVESESEDVPDVHEQKQYSADSYVKDVRDNEVYRFTEIDGKYWLAENLRYKGAVPNDSMCSDDGCFYSWNEAVGSDSAYNVCPEGWRLPSRSEWDEMLTFVANGDTENYSLGGIRSGLKAYNVGYRLCDYRDWKQGDYVLLEANDPYDFSAKHFEFTGFWTSSDTAFVEEYGDEYVEGAWMIKLRDKEAGLWLEEKEDIYPVRCVKDK